MTVLVGYLPTAEGEAAFAAGLDEAKRRGEDLLAINSPRSAPVSVEAADPHRLDDLTARAERSGVELRIQTTPHTGELADELLHIAASENASVIVIGLRRRARSGSCSSAALLSASC